MVNTFLFMLICFAVLVHAQDQSGFISIDCGIRDNSTYTDSKTGITYVSDAQYIQTSNGISNKIGSVHQTSNLDQQFVKLRCFPKGLKNCYKIPYPRLESGSRYLVRARFMYGSYDGQEKPPIFDLYFGANFWAKIEFGAVEEPVDKEILYLPRNSSEYASVCLVNTGNGTPFISALEIRLLDITAYEVRDQSHTLQLERRFDLRSYENTHIIRYPDDAFDRFWGKSLFRDDFIEVNTTKIITPLDERRFMIPSIVMANAITPANPENPIEINWTPKDPTARYYLYMHFADFQSSLTREFSITVNGKVLCPSLIPSYLLRITVDCVEPEIAAAQVKFSLIKSLISDLPPIFNAFEVYIARSFFNQPTNKEDVNAIQNIKVAYGLERDWQGDPCLPASFTWKSIGCFNISAYADPRIVLLNLSQSGLTGKISPYISNLKQLQHLDLSNNNLQGDVPAFLSEMEHLEMLILSGNNLSGVIPSKLLERSNNNLLKLSIDGNPFLCVSNSCTLPEKKSSMLPVIIGAITAVLFVLAIILVLVRVCAIRKKNSQSSKVSFEATNMEKDGPIVAQRQIYTYAEVIQMTNNFAKELGKGGFGSVYHGNVDKTQVAVKMLSPSSAQGYKQFKAEGELLMRVHHRNLTSLVGYCEEGDKLGLIYEFMANGDVETHLSDKNLECLSWELRLEIVLDAAQGLEYLHHGCKPPIIHRDIKTTNILLNEEMQAKLADFGLSKAFPNDGGTHVSTAFAGTLGYFDPEYNINEASDVYSFGVVLLEVLTGKPPLLGNDKERTHLSQWVFQTLEKKGDVRSVVDPRLNNDFDVNSVMKVVDVATGCVSHFSAERPLMKHVVNELTLCLGMEKNRRKNDYKSESNNGSIDYSANFDISDTTPIAR